MTRSTIIEKLNIIKDMVLTQPELLIVFACFMILGIILFAFSKMKKSKYIKLFLLSYILILLALIIGYNVDMYKLLDYFINNVFYLLIFPNIAVYTGMLIASNILLLTGVLGNNNSKIIKIINVIFYSLIGLFTYLIMDVIVTNKIDVYSLIDVYSNETLFALLQLSMILFIIWVVIRIIIKITNKLLTKKQNLTEVENTEEEVVNQNDASLYTPNKSNIEITFTKEEWMSLNDILKKEQNKNS